MRGHLRGFEECLGVVHEATGTAELDRGGDHRLEVGIVEGVLRDAHAGVGEPCGLGCRASDAGSFHGFALLAVLAETGSGGAALGLSRAAALLVGLGHGVHRAPMPEGVGVQEGTRGLAARELEQAAALLALVRVATLGDLGEAVKEGTPVHTAVNLALELVRLRREQRRRCGHRGRGGDGFGHRVKLKERTAHK